MTTPRCGDHVYHRPTREKWVVAYADPERDEVSWAGWPAGVARLSDCCLVRRCDDAEHRSWVQEWLSRTTDDFRVGNVRRLYGETP